MKSHLSLNDPALLSDLCLVGGDWIVADGGDLIDVVNPATGDLLGRVPNMGAAETRRAIEQAQVALGSWRGATAKHRSQVLRAWFDLVMLHRDDLALILTSEQGKPLTESRGEIVYAASYIEWYAEEAKRIYGDTIPAPGTDRRIIVQKQPVGVCVAITPWNFPAAMVTRKIAPALAAGCTMVVKPAAETPLTALALAVLAERAGVPKGVLSVVTGDAVGIGAEMTSNPIVRKLSFTGSTGVGKTLIAQCATTVKHTSMELGGNAPFIVFDDADIDAAVAGAIMSKYRNAGQTCICVNRILVQSGVYSKFVARFRNAVRMLKVGNGCDAETVIGPVISAAAIRKIEAHIADAVAKGATLEVGGQLHDLGGTFFQPTVLSHVTDKMRVFNEEIFGPIAAVLQFETDDDAIRMANDTEFGLAAYFYSRDNARIWRMAEALDYGMVGINEAMISTEVAPFGGIKQSGHGREGSFYGISDYLDIKYLCMGGL